MSENECISLKEDENEMNDYYECIMIPHVYTIENKTGVTFNGSNEECFKAHNIIMEVIKKKGLTINGTEISIADNPPNKPVSIEVKPKTGITGKANLKVFPKNGRGSATIMVTKVRGGDMVHVKTLAFKVIKYPLDNVISGDIKIEDIDSMRKKSVSKANGKKCENRCSICKKEFVNNQGMKLHMTRIHKASVACVSCEENCMNKAN